MTAGHGVSGQGEDRLGRYRGSMAPRTRLAAFGSAAALILAGAICAVLVDGLTGRILTTALMTAGLGGAILLIFLEVGLSEDREQSTGEGDRRRQGNAPQGRRQGWVRPRRRP